MSTEPMRNGRWRRDRAVADRFLDSPSEQSLEKLFRTFTPQLVAFFRSRRCEASLAEQTIPMGTVQRRVFDAVKKLAPHLMPRREGMRKAA